MQSFEPSSEPNTRETSTLTGSPLHVDADLSDYYGLSIVDADLNDDEVPLAPGNQKEDDTRNHDIDVTLSTDVGEQHSDLQDDVPFPSTKGLLRG